MLLLTACWQQGRFRQWGMMRKGPVMLVLRTLAGLTLGPALLLAALDDGLLAALQAMPRALAAAAAPAHGRAEVSVSFARDGHVAGAQVLRSTGSHARDAAARQAALQLADLQPLDTSAGRTLVFHIAFD
jgi:TonB family protein